MGAAYPGTIAVMPIDRGQFELRRILASSPGAIRVRSPELGLGVRRRGLFLTVKRSATIAHFMLANVRWSQFSNMENRSVDDYAG